MVAGVDVMAGKALAAFQSLLGDRSAWSLQRVWLDVQIRHPASDLASRGLWLASPCKATVSALLPGSVPRLPAHWRLPDSCLESTRLRAVLSFAFVLNYKNCMLRAPVRALYRPSPTCYLQRSRYMYLAGPWDVHLGHWRTMEA